MATSRIKKPPILYHGIPIVGRMPLFMAEMRQAIRDNQKTQTRRVFEPQPRFDDPIWWVGDQPFVDPESVTCYLFHDIYGMKGCPYGEVGDVRCMCEPLVRGYNGMAYYRDNSTPEIMIPVISLITSKPLLWRWKKPWLASIHMPTEAARTVCKITDIWVERLQEISDEDAEAEGIQWCLNKYGVHQWKIPGDEDGWFDYANDAYGYLWDSINAKRGYGWDVPQWVFVNVFEKLEV